MCKSEGGQLCLSDPIKIDKTSHAPIWRSKRSKRVIDATKNNLESREEFEKKHPFDERVKKLITEVLSKTNGCYKKELDSLLSLNFQSFEKSNTMA